MKMLPKYKSIKLWAVALLALTIMGAGMTGCATTSEGALDESIPQVSAQDKVQDYRTLARQLREHRFAALVQQDLDRVDGWLIEITQVLAQEDVERERVELLLGVIEGQLIEVRAHLSRLEAERSLEAERADYEARMRQIKAQREANATRLNPDASPQ